LKDKRDLHLLFKKPAPKAIEVVGDAPKPAKPEEENKEEVEEEEDVTADTNVEVKIEDSAIAIDPTGETEPEPEPTTVVPVLETSEGTDVATPGEELENKPTTETDAVADTETETVAEDDGWPKAEANETEPSGMDVDRPATPEALPASELDGDVEAAAAAE
jgi:hypothetical protein